MGADVNPTTNADLLNVTNTTVYPANTADANGGIDLVALNGIAFRGTVPEPSTLAAAALGLGLAATFLPGGGVDNGRPACVSGRSPSAWVSGPSVDRPPMQGDPEEETFETAFGTARVVTRAALLDPADWHAAFGGCAKDARYYQLCETTLPQANFDYRYLLLRDRDRPRARVATALLHRSGPPRRAERGPARAGGRHPAAVPAFSDA